MCCRGVQQQQAAQERGGISLQYRVSRGMPGTTGGGRGPPVPRLDHFAFTPIETPHGLFRMSVDFAPSSTVTILKETTSPGPVAQVPPLLPPRPSSSLPAAFHSPECLQIRHRLAPCHYNQGCLSSKL